MDNEIPIFNSVMILDLQSDLKVGDPISKEENFLGSIEPKILGISYKEYLPNYSLIEIPKFSNTLPLSHNFLEFLASKSKLNLSHKKDRGLLRLMIYLLPGGHKGLRHKEEEDSIKIYAGHELLRELSLGNKDKNFNSADILEEFSKRIWKLEWDAPTQGLKARTITKVFYPKEVLSRLAEEFSNTDPKFDIVHGPNPAITTESSNIPEVEGIQSYLSGLDPSHFQPIQDRIPEALKFIDGQHSSNWSKLQSTYQKAHLKGTATNPVILYTKTPKSPRLYPIGSNWILACRPVRKILTQDLIKMDLSSAQLRIASSLWKFELEPFLKEGSVWKYLLSELGQRPDNEALKAELKIFIYSAIFGAEKSTLKNLGTGDTSHLTKVRPHVKTLMKNPLIMKLLEVRDKAQGDLLNGNPMFDAWGTSHTIPNDATISTWAKKKMAKSIMAQVCQSYELKLLKPVFDYVKDQEEIHILGLLHDGIFCSGNWTEEHIQEVCGLVTAESMSVLGLDCPLDVERPKAKNTLNRAA